MASNAGPGRAPGHRRAVVFSLVLAAVLGAGIGATGASGMTLTLTAVETGELLLTVPVDDGTPVTLAYTHSVERTPVHDHYVVRDGRLVMTRMTFESYGWGLPSGADVELMDGVFVTEPNGTYATLTVSPGRQAGHRLIVDNRTIDLVALTDGHSVQLEVRERPVLAAITDAGDNP